MNTGKRQLSAKPIGYKLIFILVIGVAALANVKDDLNHLQALADNVWGMGSHLSATEVSARNISSGQSIGESFSGRMESPSIEVNGDIGVNVPANLIMNSRAVTFGRRPVPEAKRSMARIVRQKHVIDLSHEIERELVLKTFKGSISLRPAS